MVPERLGVEPDSQDRPIVSPRPPGDGTDLKLVLALEAKIGKYRNSLALSLYANMLITRAVAR